MGETFFKAFGQEAILYQFVLHIQSCNYHKVKEQSTKREVIPTETTGPSDHSIEYAPKGEKSLVVGSTQREISVRDSQNCKNTVDGFVLITEL